MIALSYHTHHPVPTGFVYTISVVCIIWYGMMMWYTYIKYTELTVHTRIYYTVRTRYDMIPYDTGMISYVSYHIRYHSATYCTVLYDTTIPYGTVYSGMIRYDLQLQLHILEYLPSLRHTGVSTVPYTAVCTVVRWPYVSGILYIHITYMT